MKVSSKNAVYDADKLQSQKLSLSLPINRESRKFGIANEILFAFSDCGFIEKNDFHCRNHVLRKARRFRKKWIGINQDIINRYIEHFLCNDEFLKVVSSDIARGEQVLCNSKLDFLAENTFVEV